MASQPQSPEISQPEVPEVVIVRLPQYIRVLTRLLEEGVEVVSSHQLGGKLQVTPAQIRKDLSYFGRFGKQGRGYSIRHLLVELKQITGLDRHWKVGLIGLGRLGRAILSYPGFVPEGFQIVAAFDSDPAIIGQKISELTVRPLDELNEVVVSQRIQIGIVAVPGQYAPEVINRLVECGVKAILNYAPMSPQVPDGVKIRNLDPVLSLQSMTYYLSR